MSKLKLKFNYCYGIKSLETEIDFSNGKACVIYAPNGSMKTSFAKSFKDLSLGIESRDLIFPDRVTIREIKDDTGTELASSDVFVIEPYDEEYNSDKLSTLLVQKDLKDRYDSIY